MRAYLSALVISVVMVSSAALAQQGNQQTGQQGAQKDAGPAPGTNGRAGTLTPGFAGGKPYVNTELQRRNNALQEEVRKLVEANKIGKSAGLPPSAPRPLNDLTVSTTKEGQNKQKDCLNKTFKEKDFKQFNQLSQSLMGESIADTQKQKRIEVTQDKKKEEEAPEPIKNLTPAMKKAENTDAIMAELNDGQHVVFRNNGYVSIMNERGRAITPPDGVLTLKDGTTFNIKDGMRTE